MCLRKSTIFFAVLMLSLISYSQDANFSMKSANLLYFNPGSCASTSDVKATLIHRDQWRAVGAPYKSSTLAVEGKIADKKNRYQKFFPAVGMYFTNDKFGISDVTSNQLNAVFSAILQTSDMGSFSAGLTGGYGNRSSGLKSLKWGNQYDGSYNSSIPSGEVFTFTRYSYFDVGAGIHYHYGLDESYMRANNGIQMDAGYSIFHLGVARNSFVYDTIRTGIKQTAYASLEFGFERTKMTFIPELFYQRQAKFQELQFGTALRYLLTEESKHTGFISAMAVQGGIYHRWADALILNFKLLYANYTVGLSYDINVSNLRKVSNYRGAFEIYLGFQAPNPFTKVTRSRI
ncbi:MAG: PorP/SprF family type IX secretion system membrane protein [Crocinitomicaceae bacterium]|nr:PorP/SprF family type IX secretion system membrane protein [Crocinitomicaceae bacterium]